VQVYPEIQLPEEGGKCLKSQPGENYKNSEQIGMISLAGNYFVIGRQAGRQCSLHYDLCLTLKKKHWK
jgi:hypothetical protein